MGDDPPACRRLIGSLPIPSMQQMVRVRRGVLIVLLLGAAGSPSSEVQQVPPEQALAILGHKVADAEGKDIGRLVDVLVSEQGQPQAAVIDFGGFLGVGSRKIAVQWSVLHFAPADAKHPITLELTQDQIKAAPEYKDVAKAAPVVMTPPAQADTAPGPAQPSAQPDTAPGPAQPSAQPDTAPVPAQPPAQADTAPPPDTKPTQQ